MSQFSKPQAAPPIEKVIIPRVGDIGNFEVRRALPHASQKMVGPFIFWDEAGPGEFLTGQGVDVRPHPHIGLSTVTYLMSGSLHHRDSLGSSQKIAPGDVNLMRAGSGVVHSERTPEDVRKSPSDLYGIQSWVAQPKPLETSQATFAHTPHQELPCIKDKGISLDLVMGNAFGETSPVQTDWETCYFHGRIDPGHSLKLPHTVEERAIYGLTGELEINGVTYPPHLLLILHPQDEVTIEAPQGAQFMFFGGAAMDGPRYIWWNFVASDYDLLMANIERWQKNEFPTVPEDEEEFIPLPDRALPAKEF